MSDGAHVEALGLLPLLRRRCGRIVVCDGTMDAHCAELIKVRRGCRLPGACAVRDKCPASCPVAA